MITQIKSVASKWGKKSQINMLTGLIDTGAVKNISKGMVINYNNLQNEYVYAQIIFWATSFQYIKKV